MPPDIEKSRDTLDQLRARLANISHAELVRFAESLSRMKREASTRHPMYDSPLPGRPPLSIPGHRGSVAKWTAKTILDVLERDIDAWEDQLRTKT